jgi:hypothetical protein
LHALTAFYAKIIKVINSTWWSKIELVATTFWQKLAYGVSSHCCG